MSWLSLPPDAMQIKTGSLSVYESSPTGRRFFCSKCGTQVAFSDTGRPETMDITIPSLDKPQDIIPKRNIFVKSLIPWTVQVNQLDNCHEYDAEETTSADA